MTSMRIHTNREEFHSITQQVAEAVETSGVRSGLCIVYCPHTTAGITINEDADPDVARDLLFALDKTFPDRPEYRHAEGNTAAHAKACAVGSSVTIPIYDGALALGRWQGIFFCEFDGPRQRQYYIQIVGD